MFPFLIWVICFAELFVDSVFNFYRTWKGWCYPWFRFCSKFCFGDGFLGKYLSVKLSAVLRKDLNYKFGFSSDNVNNEIL